jgi:hypothetical protein
MTLGDWLRIAQSFALLPLDTMINRVPSKCFQIEVVAKAIRGFPHFVSVAWNMYSKLCDYIKVKISAFSFGGILDNLQSTHMFQTFLKSV